MNSKRAISLGRAKRSVEPPKHPKPEYNVTCQAYSKRNVDINSSTSLLNENEAKKEGLDCERAKCVSSLPKQDAKTKATNIAQKAAMEAKAANDAQMAAADAAASQVKVELADKALQSARAAEAALAGKQQIVDQLERENCEAGAIVQEVTNSLHNTQANAAAAHDAAVEARNQLNHLKKMVQSFTKNLESIESVSNGAQQELVEKTQLLEAAKNRAQCLCSQLQSARQDFDRTKQSAYKAACAAVEAKQKAQRTKRQSAH